MRFDAISANYKKLFKLLIDRDMKKSELAEVVKKELDNVADNSVDINGRAKAHPTVSRPMNITLQLDKAIPAKKYLKMTNKLVIG